MDYIDWMEEVWRAVGAFWTPDAAQKYSEGFYPEQLAPLVGAKSPLEQLPAGIAGPLGYAIADALDSLCELQFMRTDSELPPQYRPTQLGFSYFGKTLLLFLRQEAATAVKPQHAQLLRKAVELGQDIGDNFVSIHRVQTSKVYEALSWPWQGTGEAQTITRPLRDAGLIKSNVGQTEIQISLTPKGVLWVRSHPGK